MALTPDDIKQLTDYYKQLGLTTDKIQSNINTAATNQKYLNNQLKLAKKYYEDINSDINSQYESLKRVTKELLGQKNYNRDIASSFGKISSLADKLKYDQNGISELNKKDLISLGKKLDIQKLELKNALENNKARQEELKNILNSSSERNKYNDKQLAFFREEYKNIKANNAEAKEYLESQENGINVLIEATKERLKQENNINKALGVGGNIIGGLSKTLDKLGLGGVINLEAVNDRMKEAAKTATDGGKNAATFGDKLKVLGEGLDESFSSMGEALADPILLIPIIAKQLYDLGNKADQQTTQLAKSLMLTKSSAADARQQFVEMSRSIDDSYITTDKLLEAAAALGKQLGFNKIFSQDITQTFVDLTKKIGVSEEAAGGLAKISIATGKTLKSTEQIIAGTTSRISAQNGVQLDGKEILEESGKVSGQLLANFKANPAAIAEAVAQTKVLGTTLEQTKNQSDKLLDFESSIGNQLKAELLTGQQLNLERARAAALAGDQVTVAKELANQNVDFNKFSKMNVLQQRALADALGLTADQLSDQLLKQEAIGKSREEIVALGGEEAAKRLEALSAQDKFNAAIDKLKDLVGNLVAGPFGTFLDMVSDIAGLAFKILDPFIKLASFVLKPVTGILSAITGGITDMFGGSSSGTADDMVGYGARTLLTPTGAVALNNNDTVIAGTNLSKGDDVISLPKGSLNLGGDNSEMANILKEIKSAIISGNNQQGTVMLDGRNVGTALVQGTYKSA